MRGTRDRAGARGARSGGRRIASVGLAVALGLGVITTTAGTARAEDPPPPPTPVPGCANRQVKSDLAVPPSVQATKTMVYDCSFSDDFDGTTYDASKWTAQRTSATGYKSGDDACFVDSPNNISVSGGSLQLTARKESEPIACPGLANPTTSYTSGSLTSTGKFTQTYGRFEIRAKMPAVTVPGAQFSFWLYPENRTKYGAQWPSSGELDVMEWYSQYANLGIPYIHYKGDNADPKRTNTSCPIGNPTDWHTYAMEWSPDAINMIYDGVVCLRNTSWSPNNGITMPAPFDSPFNLNLTEALGVATNAFNPNSTPLPDTATVDYAYAWVGHIEDKPTVTFLSTLKLRNLSEVLRSGFPIRCLICQPTPSASTDS